MIKPFLEKIDQKLSRVIEILLVVIGLPFFAMLMVEVLSRKLLNHSLFGVYELAGYLSIWFSMLGAFLGYRNRELARLNFLVKRLSPRWRRLVFAFNWLLVMTVLSLLAVSAVVFTYNPAIMTQTSVSFAIPIYIFYLGIPVGLILMAFQTLIQIFIRDIDSLMEETEVLE
ncbi:MAG TPA: TRAP transporter small permease [Desulfobacteria bacterium]|nr:TRAP transporter small permease [Desulfobacteria bacterium]